MTWPNADLPSQFGTDGLITGGSDAPSFWEARVTTRLNQLRGLVLSGLGGAATVNASSMIAGTVPASPNWFLQVGTFTTSSPTNPMTVSWNAPFANALAMYGGFPQGGATSIRSTLTTPAGGWLAQGSFTAYNGTATAVTSGTVTFYWFALGC